MNGEKPERTSEHSHGKRRVRRRRKKRRKPSVAEDPSFRSRIVMGLAVIVGGLGALVALIYGLFAGLKWLLEEMS